MGILTFLDEAARQRPKEGLLRSLKDGLLLMLSGLALMPVLLFFVKPDTVFLWPSMLPGPKSPVMQPLPKPPEPAKRAKASESEASVSTEKSPNSALHAISNRIAQFWDAGRYGPFEKYLPDGKVRVIIYAPRSSLPSLYDFWSNTCNDSTVRYVIILPHGAPLPAALQNIVFVRLDETETATMPLTATVWVFAQDGRVALRDTFADFGRMQTAVRSSVHVAKNLGNGQPAPASPQVQAAMAQPPPPPPVPSLSPVSPQPASEGNAPVHHAQKTATKTPAPHTENAGSSPPPPRPITSIASLDARLQPLFHEKATSLLQLQEVRKARAKSRPVVLCFWATYCAPCVAELSELSAIHEEHPNVVFVGLLQDSNISDVRALARKMIPDGFEAHYFLSDGLLQKRIFHATQIPLPAFAVFDGHGHMRDAFIGSLIAVPANRERLLALLESKD